MKDIKFGKIITSHNPRNSKKKQGVSFMNKLMSKDRIKIEHYFAKLKKRTKIENRFDRYKINFECTVKLTATFYMFSSINQMSNS